MDFRYCLKERDRVSGRLRLVSLFLPLTFRQSARPKLNTFQRIQITPRLVFNLQSNDPNLETPSPFPLPPSHPSSIISSAMPKSQPNASAAKGWMRTRPGVRI